MMTAFARIAGGTVLLSSVGLVSVRANEASDLKLQLMKSTKVIAVMGLSVPADKFVSDGDPDTLQIVFMSKPEDGPSHVSDDGEVIFLSRA